LIYFRPEKFPIAVNGEIFTLEALLAEVAQIIAADPLRVEDAVGKDGFEKIRSMCINYGLDPETFA